jgi:peptidoglycan hydrolase-like protein with peptidoglycan-binding domain
MAKSISASVGEGGVNRSADVKTIQELLNQIPVSKGGPQPLLAVDGLVGPKTIGAIRQFQKFHFGWSDGRVDTNNVTIAKLNELTAIPPAPPGPPVRFEESKVNNGFDGKVTPPWQMVPVAGFKIVKVTNTNGVTFSCKNPAVASVVQISPNQIQIGGLSHATTVIEAKDAGGRVVGTLEVAVKNKKTVVTSFFFVEDSATPVKHKTGRKVGDEVNLTKLVNAIYEPQTNIEFKVRSAKPLPIAKDLGPVIRWALNIPGVPVSEDEWNLIKSKRDPGADFNVFFVWEYEQDATPNVDDAEAGTISKDKMTIMEDNLTDITAEEVLAHEAGHFLKVSAHSNDQDDLMVGAGKSKLKIPKAHANIMNP